MIFSSWHFLQKTNDSILLLWDLFSFVFWRKLKTPKRNFEINWTLSGQKIEKKTNSQQSLWMTPKEDKVDWYWTDVHLLTFCLQTTVVFLFFYVCSVPAICNKRIEAVYYYVLWIQPLCWRDCFSCRHRKASQWCPENQGIQAYFYSIFIKLRFSEKVKKKMKKSLYQFLHYLVTSKLNWRFWK